MNRSHWIGLAALLVLALGVGLAVRQFAPGQRPPAGAALTAEDPGSGVVAEAMRQAPAAPVDSAEIKARWQEEVRGVDILDFEVEQREIFLRYANSERCTCGCGYTLAGCKASDMSCEVSQTRLEALIDSVRTGKIRTAVGLRERPRHGG